MSNVTSGEEKRSQGGSQGRNLGGMLKDEIELARKKKKEQERGDEDSKCRYAGM